MSNTCRPNPLVSTGIPAALVLGSYLWSAHQLRKLERDVIRNTVRMESDLKKIQARFPSI